MKQPLAEQPLQVDIYADDDLFVKLFGPCPCGAIVPQHSHAYAHPTAILAGRWQVWCSAASGVVSLVGNFGPGKIVTIPAHAKHKFICLDDGGMLACMHNLRGQGYPEVEEEHQLFER